MEFRNQIFQKTKYFYWAGPSFLDIAFLADSCQRKVSFRSVPKVVDYLIQRNLRSHPLECLGQDHLANSDHASPSRICFNTINFASVSKPDDVIEIQVKFFFVFAFIFVNSAQKYDWLIFIQDYFLSFGEDVKRRMS